MHHFCHHTWIQTRVTVRKLLSSVMTSVTFDLWPLPFAWTSLLSLVITAENFVMIREEHSEKGVTDRQTERGFLKAAWLQLKINQWACFYRIWFWSPMPCEKHGPRASVTTKTSAFGRFSLLSPSGHVFHTARETMIKSYNIITWINSQCMRSFGGKEQGYYIKS